VEADSENFLSGAHWDCAWSDEASAVRHADLDTAGLEWMVAQVPGTAAGALALANQREPEADDLDGKDWWFRTQFEASAHCEGRLWIDGIATVWEVHLNGHLVGRGSSMFEATRIPVLVECGTNELVVSCRALNPVLGRRQSRPRWKSYLVTHQNLRWVRTTLLGRLCGWAQSPPPVGPWRPVRLSAAGRLEIADCHLLARVDGDDGVIEAEFRVLGGGNHDPVPVDAMTVSVGDSTVPARAIKDGDDLMVSARVMVPAVDRWWPHTHGDQPLYDVAVTIGDERFELGRVGFRTVAIDRRDGAFQISVNGVDIFCRGANWIPPDPVALWSEPEEDRRRVELAKAAHINMLRIPGTTVYADHAFLSLCDELGILVWHDAMFAFLDPPVNAEFTEAVLAEVIGACRTWSSHPSLAVVCGSQEIDEVAAMNGLSQERRHVELTEKTIPNVLQTWLPDTPYVKSNPSGGAQPFQMDEGVCQYFGVGGYLRPLDDARRAQVRFASECLALSTPPERESIELHWGGAWAAGHDPNWKRAVHHDAGRSWDMEDVRDHYVQELFGVDPLHERYEDPEHALDLGRAANAELMQHVFTEWRRADSPCAGGLVLALCDLRPGAGWGVIDVDGLPKAPWYTMRRLFAPQAAFFTDEGLNGLRLHLVNDAAVPMDSTVQLELFSRKGHITEVGESRVCVKPRGSLVIDAGSLLDGFRDITYAFRFNPPAHDVVFARWNSASGTLISQAIYLPLGPRRPREGDVGLVATGRPLGSGTWEVTITTRRFAQWVSVSVPGFQPSDSWFHLPPGATRIITLDGGQGSERPRGSVRSINGQNPVRISFAKVHQAC
jgi:beta-mannosidase